MVCANFLITCNPKDAVRKTVNGRKFAIFYTAQQSERDIVRDRMDGDYFPKIYDWLRREGYAVVTHFLQNYRIPQHLNPAIDCHRAPVTSSTEIAVIESAGRMEQEIRFAVESDLPGFRGGWLSSHFLDAMLRNTGLERHYPRNKRRGTLLEMGYLPHPGYPDGHAHNPIAPDGARTRLFVLRNHPTMGLAGADVARAYAEAQSPFKTPA